MSHLSLASTARLFVLAAVVTAPLVADAKPKGKQAAKAHVERATKAHKDGKFEVALAELQAAYAIDPQDKLVFAIAQVQAKLDNCAEAIDNYEKFLAATKDKQKQAVVKQAIAACKSKLAADKPAEPPQHSPPAVDSPANAVEMPPAADPPAASPTEIEEPPGAGSSIPPAPETGSRRGSPWYKDVLGDALVAGGVATGVVSIVMYRGALSDLDAAESAGSLADYQRFVDRAHDRRTYAVVFAGASAALIGAGVLRYALRDTKERSSVAISPAPGGGLVTWATGF